MAKRVPLEMIAVLLITTILCFGALLFALTFMSESQADAVETTTKQTTTETYSFAYPAPIQGTQTFIFGTDEGAEEDDVEDDNGLSSADKQTLENAENAIDEIEEALDDIQSELNDVEDDIDDADDESDIDDIYDDLDDLEDDLNYQQSKISRWYNILEDIDGSEANSLQNQLNFLEQQAEDLQDEINDAEDDAEDEEDEIEEEEEESP